jgi:hypothetical protein
MLQDKREMLLDHKKDTIVALLTRDVTSGLGRPLAAEINKSPIFDCRRKSHLTSQRYTLETKHVLNTTWEAWSLHHLVKLFPVSDDPCGRNRYFEIIDNRENLYKFRMMRAR